MKLSLYICLSLSLHHASVFIWFVIKYRVKIMVTPATPAVGVLCAGCVTIISGALSRLFIIVIFLGTDTKSGHALHSIYIQSCNIWLLRAASIYCGWVCATTKRATLQVLQTDICGQTVFLIYLRSQQTPLAAVDEFNYYWAHPQPRTRCNYCLLSGAFCDAVGARTRCFN